MIEVTLADGKARQIHSMTATTFWSVDGRPMSAAQFLEALYGVFVRVLQGRRRTAHLVELARPRRKLLKGLAEDGFSREPLAETQKAIEA